MDVEDWPAYIATDRTGRHLTVAFYGGARAGVYPIGADGELGRRGHRVGDNRRWRPRHPHRPLQSLRLRAPHRLHTGQRAGTAQEHPRANVIHQFRFDADTGRLTPNDPLVLEMNGFLGPRHYCYHPSLDVVYFSDEQGSSVTAYNMDSEGRLSAFQTISTLPEGHTERNTCSQIQMTSDGGSCSCPTAATTASPASP